MTIHGTFSQRRPFFQSQTRSSTAANFFLPANVTNVTNVTKTSATHCKTGSMPRHDSAYRLPASPNAAHRDGVRAVLLGLISKPQKPSVLAMWHEKK